MKIDRLLAITMMLINRDKITAKELSDHFEVSIRTIYRDIEAINQAGIPVVAYQGNNGGFGIMENYRIDRHVLTPDDVGAIMTALNGVSTTMEDRKITNTLEKIRGLIPDRELEIIKKQTEQVMIDFNPWGVSKKEKEKFQLIRSAVEENRCIGFTYTNSKNETVERLAEPMVMMFKGTVWYLYAFCRMKNDFRIFRLSRIRNVQKSPESFVKREFNPENLSWDKGWSETGRYLDLVLRFKPELRLRVEESYGLDNMETLEDGSFQVRSRLPDEDWTCGYILGFGDGVEVLEPLSFRETVREAAKRIFDLYKN